jgi:hypothetical protein
MLGVWVNLQRRRTEDHKFPSTTTWCQSCSNSHRNWDVCSWWSQHTVTCWFWMWFLYRVLHWIHGWGLSMGSIPGTENWWCDTYCWVVFIGRQTRVPNIPFLCYILYIEQWGFHCIMCKTIANGVLESRSPGQTRALFKFRQSDDFFHTLKTVKGLMHLVPSRTPRSSGYGVLYTCGLCYMLFLLCVYEWMSFNSHLKKISVVHLDRPDGTYLKSV